jgi:hypothetical protein
MNELVSALLPMKLDVYRQYDEQDVDTGAIKKEWHFYKTIDCYAKGFIGNSATSRSGDKQQFNNRYVNEQTIEIRAEDKLSIREKVTNIRDRKNNYIWTELDFPTETPTVFEIYGVTPITDPFGLTIAYNMVAKRSENQGIGL